jgi:hypothetical protein
VIEAPFFFTVETRIQPRSAGYASEHVGWFLTKMIPDAMSVLHELYAYDAIDLLLNRIVTFPLLQVTFVMQLECSSTTVGFFKSSKATIAAFVPFPASS